MGTAPLMVSVGVHVYEGAEITALVPERSEFVIVRICGPRVDQGELNLCVRESEIERLRVALLSGKRRLTTRQNSPEIRDGSQADVQDRSGPDGV